MIFNGFAKNGGLAFDNPTLQRRQAFLSNIKDDTKIIEEVKRDVPSKTAAQCRAIFGVYLPVIWSHMNEHGFDIGCLTGKFLSHDAEFVPIVPSQDTIRYTLYDHCGGVGDGGENLTLSKMNINQCMAFMDNVDKLTTANIGLPMPELNQKKLEELFPPAPQ